MLNFHMKTATMLRFQAEHDVITEIVTICNSILHFEALRTRTTEAFAADEDFTTLLQK